MPRMSPLSVILLSSIIVGVVAISPPGLKARITPKFLQFVNQRAKIEIPKLARYRSLPDQEGDYNIYIGTIHYSVNGPFADGGNLTVFVKGVSLDLSIIIGYDYMGRPTVQTTESYCTFSVDEVSVSVRGSGTYDWIYEWIEGSIGDTIKNILLEQACSGVVEEVNTNATEKLRQLKVVRPITKKAEIDLRLMSQPEFGPSVTTCHKGTVYETAYHWEPPFNVSVLPFDPDQTKMAFIWITDYVANSASYVLHNTRFFQYLLTEDNIPAGVNLNLNTSGLQMKYLFPQLSKLYPKKLVQIYMNTTAPPKVTFGVDNISVIIEGDVVVFVVQQNRSLTYVFTLGATVKVRAELGTDMTNVTWDKASISYDVKLLKSAISDFKIKELQRRLKLALKVFIMPKMEQMGKVGIPLPSLPLQGYGLRHFNISHGQNFLKLGTDIYYHGWLRDKLSKTRT